MFILRPSTTKHASYFMTQYTKIPFLMKMVTDRVSTIINRDLSMEYITATQGRVLMYLISRNGGDVSQKDVEQYLGVSHTTAKGIIQRLEEKGLLTTAFDNKDKRVKNIYLTETSIQMHKVIEKKISSMAETLLKDIPKADRELLGQLLQRMHDNIM